LIILLLNVPSLTSQDAAIAIKDNTGTELFQVSKFMQQSTVSFVVINRRNRGVNETGLFGNVPLQIVK
jgi:hypothetical protein